MSLILHLETATTSCSVALAKQGQLLSLKEQNSPNIHAGMITLFIQDVMKESGYTPQQLDAISISMGPGSYTGLRIGVSTAKGLCYALDKPLISVNSLLAMANGMKTKTDESVLLCPMIDARRMEVYSAIYNHQLEEIRETVAEIIDETSFSSILQDQKILFFGNGAGKCATTIIHPNASFINNFENSAAYLIEPALEKFNKNIFENVAYFEPFYLKDFFVTQKKI
ncbi:tRNA (adenosine(37)-N6)-threonylcarbamoyltransferase complex dimerization subunit type 1 TsaB [Solitalea koreensis]|uniref:tRNA threonylcarbamoyladenosine biosynthesis protein TsaB n=1 Tax=Solitalea koreensis TaxID=543615 RepID=A0A521EBV8_9SPHI|nr:tRNA (adenosine(37)-N6)-threonylcarbamoyltransferase complex dimerization subunit type 1 TsaB [Solitalea koreensis]SMO81416.1 tRNA threonylcarbamoyladenosine biosynthesis protein TsaB [Solitalea koreensis]